ncbi:hypothetical protein PTKU64_90920 (plasmid) [Paraburkholderia terrae]|uniref:DUF4148 domain-containing protein n=1 Tax=Paraburkholderia terrae TaxID=311230 RepID=A0ABM7U2N8_9BURK|nr:DUF4148 domain-containing protein [Paraburkholderia terrae]BCZ85417.1 hypothetical protein PTKU64_90920 [Paraburkholderia terrae]
MKYPSSLYLSIVILAVPVCASAQATATPGRAQLRGELAELEQHGYNPSDWVHYPQNLVAAETRRKQAVREQEPVAQREQIQASRSE